MALSGKESLSESLARQKAHCKPLVGSSTATRFISAVPAAASGHWRRWRDSLRFPARGVRAWVVSSALSVRRGCGFLLWRRSGASTILCPVILRRLTSLRSLVVRTIGDVILRLWTLVDAKAMRRRALPFNIWRYENGSTVQPNGNTLRRMMSPRPHLGLAWDS